MRDQELTAAQAADLFGIPRRTIYNWITSGMLYPVNVATASGCKGRVRYFKLSEVAAVVADQRTTRHAGSG